MSKGPSTDEGVRTVRFSLDGRDYEIDLGLANAARLRVALARFVEHASPAPKRQGARRSKVTRPVVSGADQTRAIRQWAVDNGFAVSARGRIPRSVLEAFDRAH